MMPDQAVGTNFDLDPEILGQAGRDIDLEADQPAVLVLHRPGLEGVHADAQDPFSA